MRLITLTRKSDGAKMYVNPENVCAVYQYYKKESTVIQFVGAEENFLEVLDSVDSVASMMKMREVNRMADYVPYEVIMERVKDDIDYIAEQAYERGKRDILEQLQTTPTDHVLCMNCKHRETTGNYNYCKVWRRETSIDGYCHMGDAND